MIEISKAALRTEMLSRGWSPLELARRAGIAERGISYLLKNGHCRYKTAYKIAQALGVEPAKLVNFGKDDD